MKIDYKHAIPIGISLIAIIISITSLNLSCRTNHLHIIPNLQVSYLQDDKHDYIVFRNNSPVEIVSLSVNYKAYGFDKKQGKYRTVMPGGNINVLDDAGENWIIVNSLKPHKVVQEYLGEMTSGLKSPQEKFITTRVFDITYYRAKDMSKFDKRQVYFIDEGKAYSLNEARKMSRFRKPIMELNSFIRKYEGLNFNRKTALNIIKN